MLKRLPKIKRLQTDLVFVDHPGEQVIDNRIYNVLLVVLHMLDQQETDSTFRHRLRKLIEGVPASDCSAMGFPGDWKERKIWN